MSELILPTYDEMMNPLLQALHSLGGSGTIEEIYDVVIDILKLSDEQLEVLHNPEKSSRTEVGYRLAWTRTYLKKFGLLENSSRGVWALTAEGRKTNQVNRKMVVQTVKAMDSTKKYLPVDDGVELDESVAWRDELISVLLQMDPSAFERLFQRILREDGFVQVEVTGRSGDGGIDGSGIVRIGGFLSFHVLFQCKRWRGSIGASVVRDFRGAMVGRADKGLLVTTGNFTKDAVREATRDGAPAIDLIDGEQLLDKLKELKLGVNTEIVISEIINIKKEWFENI